MIFTKSYLHNLYIEEQKKINEENIIHTISQIKKTVIETAKKGQYSCKESFPNITCHLQADIFEELIKIFPDSKIQVYENDTLHVYPRCLTISINWE
jgi:hypothetical protein